MFGPKRTHLSLIFLFSVGLSPQKTSSATQIDFLKTIHYKTHTNEGLCVMIFVLLVASMASVAYSESKRKKRQQRIKKLEQSNKQMSIQKALVSKDYLLLKGTVRNILLNIGIQTQNLTTQQLCDRLNGHNTPLEAAASQLENQVANLRDRDSVLSDQKSDLEDQLKTKTSVRDRLREENQLLKKQNKTQLNNLKKTYNQLKADTLALEKKVKTVKKLLDEKLTNEKN